MLIGAIGPRMTQLLREANELGDFGMSLVCTDAGLLLASAGDDADEDQLAGLTSLFDDIVTRAVRDLHMGHVDEVALLDPRWGRCVIRPLRFESDLGRLFLVVRVPPRKTWRRTTNQLIRTLTRCLEGHS